MGVEVETIHWRIKLAAEATIEALALLSPTARVLPILPQLVVDDSNRKLPAIHLTNDGETEEPAGGDTENIHTWYPLRVLICDRNTGRQHGLEPYLMYWRREVRRAFEDKKLDGVPEVAGCDWRPNVIIDPAMPGYQFVVSGMLLRFYTVEART